MKRILLYGLLLAAIGLQAQDVLPYPTDTIDGKVYYRYTVEKSIGLYRISKNFGVTQEAILEANPELKSRGLRYEEVIRIPTNLPATKKEATVPQEKPTEIAKPQEKIRPIVIEKLPELPKREIAEQRIEVTAVADTTRVEEVKDEVAEEIQVDEMITADLSDTLEYSDTVRLAILLPLHANVAQRSPSIDRFYDFYAGALLALKHHEGTYTDSTGAQHTTFYDVQTYDTGKDGQLICQLTDSNRLSHTDAIIGPAYAKQVEVLSNYAKEHEIPVMVPFLPMVPEVQNNPYLLKFNPSNEVQIHALMDHLDTLRSSINIVLVDAYSDKLDYSAGIRGLRDSIRARQLPTTHTTIRKILADSVSTALKDSVENILLFHSERYSNVQLLMPYLLSGKRSKCLTILSQYAWQNESIVLPQLFTTVFRTSDSEAMRRYEQDYTQYFGHPLSSTLPRYDLLGYDLTGYMLEALRGGTFNAADTTYEGIQSSIQFIQRENGGYENTHIIVERH